MPSPSSRLLTLLLIMMQGISASDPRTVQAKQYLHNERSNRGIAYSSWSPRGCLYEGQWHMNGHEVVAHTACLRCTCSGGVLTCSRRACQPLPDPPPPRCHLLHKKGRCCPELHCPNEIIVSEQVASNRLEDPTALTTSAIFNHACVEGGTVYAAGSAMESPVACEQCFCLRGVRRCVRPTCLPLPPGCSGRPVAGLCCPQRYYCQHDTTKRPDIHTSNDCLVEGVTILEGNRVPQWEESRNCSQCFCLHGFVRCQELSCAPPLLGCQPLLRPGECCAHQYRCHHDTVSTTTDVTTNRILVTMLIRNDLLPIDVEDRSFHSNNPDKQDTTNSSDISDEVDKEASTTTSSIMTEIITNKIKRKTIDSVPITRGLILEDDILSTNLPTTQSITDTTFTDTTEETTTASAVIESEKKSVEPQEGTVKIMINGTINCSTEFSSTSEPVNVTVNETEQIIKESIPRVPYVTRLNEEHTFNPIDIITDRNVNGGFDENETFTINVTSSLRTNTSQSQLGSSVDDVSKPGVVTDLKLALNTSQPTTEVFDYDYIEPNLPPSLPNLKIIPFVAADAVVDSDEITSKVTYPILEREDKFPVFYPKENEETSFASRREDVYHPTNYPIFTSVKTDRHKPLLAHDLIMNKDDVFESSNQKHHIYSVSLNTPELSKAVTKSSDVTVGVEKTSANLFSPPIETEGGFIPKNPIINGNYLSVYMSTPSAIPHVPHLTTSMQLDTDTESCTSSDGRRVKAGDYVTVSCSECVCVWGEMHCSPRLGDKSCCGDVPCEQTEDPTETGPDENFGENLEAANSEDNTDMTTSTTDAANITIITDSTFTTISTTPTIETTRKENSTPPTTSIPLDYEEDDEEEGFLGNVLKLLLSESFDVNKAAPPRKKLTTPVMTTESASTTNNSPNISPNNNYKPHYSKPNPTVINPSRVPSSYSTSHGTLTKLISSSSIQHDIPTRSPFSSSTPHSAPARLNTSNDSILPQISSTVPFVPLPRRPVRLPDRFTDNSLSHLYPLNFPPQRPLNSVNRIDHLVLGEATAIHRTTVKPVSTDKPVTTSVKPVTESRTETAKKLLVTMRPPETTTKAHFENANSLTNEVRPSVNSVASGVPLSIGGILRLAGCNIYGKMYKVGGRIAELSTPCEECSCTEIGIQCKHTSC